MYRNFGFLVTAVIVAFVMLGVRPEQALSEANLHEEPRTASGSNKPAFAPGRILVKAEEGTSADDLASLNRKNGAHVEEKLPKSRLSVVDLPKNLSVAEAVERYEASPDVEYAEPDYLLYPAAEPNDPEFPKQYNLHNTGQFDGTVDADIDAREAWGVTTGDARPVVAVIDTGVDIKHPDLKDNIWTNPGEVPGNSIDDDHNGYVDDVNGWDFHNDDNSVFDSAVDDAHGTHVAGTIAANGNNGVGVTGVGWQAKVMPLKFLGPDVGYHSDAIEALNYAAAEGVKVSNNSWGGGPFSQSLFDAIKRADAAGLLFVASAGNKAQDTDLTPHYPSGYDSPNIIAVAASDQDDSLAVFSDNRGGSNYGAVSVDLAAPGRYILSTLPGNRYAYYEGTSMAAPHVSGAAALLESKYPTWGDTEIKAHILQTVDKKTSLQNKTLSGGRLNVARALGAATQSTRLTLKASPTLVKHGKRTTLTGMLSSSSVPLPEQAVALWRSTDGGRTWAKAGTAAYDTSSETYKATHRLRRNTTFQLRFAEEGDYKAARSRELLVKVRAR